MDIRYEKTTNKTFEEALASIKEELSIASRIDQPCLFLGQPVPRNRPLSA